MEVFGLEAIALKDVPAGVSYKIMEADDVPDDRDGWAVDDAELTDGVGAFYGAGSKYEVVGYTDDLTPVLKEKKTVH